MKNLVISATLAFFMLSFLVCSCSDDEDQNITDGDVDSLEDETEQTQDPQCYARAEPEIGISGDEEGKSDFEDACVIENSSGYLSCCNQLIEFLSGNGTSDGVIQFCEESSCTGIADIFPVWPGPGFGLGMVGHGASVPTGWYGPECFGDPEIVWTDETKAAIADRTPKDTDCATITDAFTCATTHNPPAHCAMTLGWPLIFGEDNDFLSDQSCTGVKGAVFIGCHQEYEPGAKIRLGMENDSEHYSGPIRNTKSGECLGYSGYENHIPANWEKADNAACAVE